MRLDSLELLNTDIHVMGLENPPGEFSLIKKKERKRKQAQRPSFQTCNLRPFSLFLPSVGPQAAPTCLLGVPWRSLLITCKMLWARLNLPDRGER